MVLIPIFFKFSMAALTLVSSAHRIIMQLTWLFDAAQLTAAEDPLRWPNASEIEDAFDVDEVFFEEHSP